MADIGKEIEENLPRELLGILRAAGELAAGRGQSIYLVGGAVRDLLMGWISLDLDLVLEGDAPSLARQLAKVRQAKVVMHPRFGTATLREGVVSVDIVTARAETYAEPGALPEVKPGTIRDDLFRRDFTINAMAAHIDPERFGELVDPYGGKDDLEKGLIRVLHERSFQDDPTRIWRAVRYEQRFGFRLEIGTEKMMRRDLDVMDRVSGDRLRHELERILQEDRPEKALNRAGEIGALQKLSPSLVGNGWLVERFEQARKTSPGEKPDDLLYLALLVWRLEGEEVGTISERLRFGREAARMLRDIPSFKKALTELEAGDLLPSGICRLLHGHHPEAILAAAVATDSAVIRQRLALYLSNLRFVAPDLDGEDLKKMGVPQGRKLGWLLRALREARLDGRVTTRKGERELVRQWLVQSK